VLEKFEQPPLPIHIVYPTSRLLSAKVRTFVDLVIGPATGISATEVGAGNRTVVMGRACPGRPRSFSSSGTKDVGCPAQGRA